MKKRKKILLLSLAMLGVVGTQLAMDNIAISAKADGSVATISEDGFTKTFDIRNSDVSVNKNSYYYDATDKLYYQALSSSWSSPKSDNNKMKKLNLYFEVPSTASGTITVTCAGSDTSRFLYYTSDVNGTARNTATDVSFAYVGSKKTVSNPFTSSDIISADIEGTTRYFIGLTAAGTDYKVNQIDIALNKEGAVENFHGSLIPKYVVTYYSDSTGAELVNSMQVEEGKYAENIKLNDEEGKVFRTWQYKEADSFVDYDFTTPVMGDLSLYASWDVVSTFTVTIEDNYEGAVSKTAVFNNGAKLVLEDPEPRENYKFVGWYKDQACTDGNEVTEETIVESDMTVYAKWEATTYAIITFKNGETDYDSKRTFTNEVLVDWPSAPEAPAGYVFDGWFDAEGKEYTVDSTFAVDITLYAHFDLTPVQYYNFTDYANDVVLPSVDGTNFVKTVVEEGVITLGNGKVGNGANAGTRDGMNLSTYAQSSRLYLTLAKNAEVTLYLTQTSSQDRHVAISDNEGYTHITDKIPAVKKSASSDAVKQTFTLEAGSYEFFSYEVSSSSFKGSFNYYAVKIDYTNHETITSELTGTQSFKLNNQKGHNAEGKKAMRFVGEINYAPVEELYTIQLNVEATKQAEIGDETQTLFSDYIYVVYDSVASAEGAKYSAVENRLYFEYIVDVEDAYKTVSCSAVISLLNGTTVTLTNTFDCAAAFVE